MPHLRRNCYLSLLDGASNEQGGDLNLVAVMSWASDYKAYEHAIGLDFKGISCIPEVSALREESKIINYFFMHHQRPKAQLEAQS